MAAITQIEINGFKAFPTNFTLRIGENHNVLVYGENGSGKSSIYYALHALLQSVFKDDKGAKYFKPGDYNGETFIPNNEHLINIYRIDEAKVNTFLPYIRVIFDDKIWRLDSSGLATENGGKESEIRMLNKYSAFINHSYITRFHSARNSEEMNLWNVFYKDILPFHVPAGTTKFLADLYDEIVADSKGKVNTKDKIFTQKIVSFNSLLSDSIQKINTKINGIYNDHFKNFGDNNITIKLLYYNESDPENKQKERYYLYYNKTKNKGKTSKAYLHSPRIGIEIKEGGKLIYKPQSHFNEAKLTAIALAVRFAAMSTTSVTPGSFLALDDMLISLDMSNRMKVIRYLLDVAAPKYKLYIFTHDRLFYHTLKRIIETQYTESEWMFGGLYINDLVTPNEPNFILDNKTKIDKIEEAYKQHDYFRCGTLLRQECERCLHELLPATCRIKEDSQTKLSITKNLDEQIISLEDFCKNEQIDFTPFQDLKAYKDLFLNSTAHNDITSPFYSNEIKVCMKAVKSLAQIKRAQEIKCHKDLSIYQRDEKGNNYTLRLRLREPLLLLEYNDIRRISFYSKCIVLEMISEDGKEQIKEGFESVYIAYNNFCEKYKLNKNHNLLEIILDRDIPLKDKL